MYTQWLILTQSNRSQNCGNYMDEMSIWRLKALRLPVGLLLAAAWLFVFITFNPSTTESYGSFLNPDTIEQSANYTNMLICGVFCCVMGLIFLSITYSTAVRRLAIEPSRSDLFSERLFRNIGGAILILGVVSIVFALAKPI